MHQIKYENYTRWVSVSGSPSHPTMLSASPTQLLVGQLTRLPFHSGYATAQSALELGPSHCPNGRLGQYIGFVGVAFALKLPELLNTNLVTVRAKLGQTSSFPKGPKFGSQ